METLHVARALSSPQMTNAEGRIERYIKHMPVSAFFLLRHAAHHNCSSHCETPHGYAYSPLKSPLSFTRHELHFQGLVREGGVIFKYLPILWLCENQFYNNNRSSYTTRETTDIVVLSVQAWSTRLTFSHNRLGVFKVQQRMQDKDSYHICNMPGKWDQAKMHVFHSLILVTNSGRNCALNYTLYNSTDIRKVSWGWHQCKQVNLVNLKFVRKFNASESGWLIASDWSSHVTGQML